MSSDVDYDKLPEHLRESFRMWIEAGYYPGHFLQAILHNDLFEAVGRADQQNMPLIPLIVSWVYNEAPSNCWGSKDKTRAWHEKFWPVVAEDVQWPMPGRRLDDGSNEAIADREEFDDHELNP